ncbi:hypothetical protein BCY86_05525 [Pajaroellobacter abortibovis]|uniref:Uncharacterized protein n=1 Tax=Pajaroellobacter abortibovis TaxID=1882918 RepID=A0A1L6MXE6_9BACT|nr:hypothetical protein BCY86_05525 [Pajaroellobacter abortibovis]
MGIYGNASSQGPELLNINTVKCDKFKRLLCISWGQWPAGVSLPQSIVSQARHIKSIFETVKEDGIKAVPAY